MRASWYARALYDISLSGLLSEEKTIAHFMGTLSANGHTHMLPRILRVYERIATKEAKKETIVLTTATEIPEAHVAALLRKEPFSHILSGAHRRVERVVDESIIGGAIARTSTLRVDHSHKNMLVQIYQNMTNQL